MAPLRNVKVEISDSIAVVTIHRPEALNALNRHTLEELETVLSELRDTPEASALILTGSGEKAFVAGADIKEMEGMTPLQALQMARRGQRIFSRVERFPKPVVAAVNGFCLGGGCELALACHLRIATENAKFGQPEVKLGLIPGYGGTQRLPRLVGRAVALEMVLSGEMIDAQRALETGLVNRVVPAEDLLTASRELCEKMLSNAPVALRLGLEAVVRGSEMPLEDACAFEASLFGVACSTDDMREGITAFVKKRRPEFKGR